MIDQRPHPVIWRLKRRLKSTWDAIFFCYYRIANHFWVWLAASIGFLALSAIFPRHYGLPYWLVPFAFVTIYVLALVARWTGPFASPGINVDDDNAFIKALKRSIPSDREKIDGFETYSDVHCPEGPVITSKTFNKDCIANEKWKPKLLRLDRKPYERVIEVIKRRKSTVYKYLIQQYWKALLSLNPLTNDSKIGFHSPILSTTTEIKIYHTDYFAAYCNSDLTPKRITARGADGRKEPLLFAGKDICPIIEDKKGGNVRMLELGDTSKPGSLHGGVDMIAITSDNWLCFAVQSGHAKFSGGKLAPLASGSMDWEDQENCTELKELILKAATRELVEEWGKKHPNKPALRVERMSPIGYFRMPHRGGKPQFVVFAKLFNEVADLRADTSEVELDPVALFEVRSFEEFKEAAKTCLAGGTYLHSVPVFGALTCLDHAIHLYPDVICDVAGYDRH